MLRVFPATLARRAAAVGTTAVFVRVRPEVHVQLQNGVP
jgi:hypothetical protein